MMNFSDKKRKQIAISALINGFKQTSEAYSIPEDQVMPYLENLINGECSLFELIRNEILSSAQNKGIKSTCESWGLSSECLEKLINAFPDFVSNKKYCDTCSFINPQELKTWSNVSVQPTGPNDESTPKKKRKTGEDKRKVTNYSIDQKIQAVKEFVKGTNQSETARELQIPAVNLMRWRDKIRKEAFQEPHVENLYGVQKRGQRNKMFRDLDARVYAWYKENKDKKNIDEELMHQARSIVKIDESEPIIAEIWLSSFKKHYKIE
ncbi:hypothetical protein SteCoe_2464 [Stentor coeruleus]|uniref:HTH CENPB-type domain-containing protein n=1 Tax=Stentor coeruleus TaxID=5963 RepID=A0A1R2CZK1_9CILI|nr:hypothetical protein SteCoe_2464 [Stentor coeruleus]